MLITHSNYSSHPSLTYI